MKKNFVLKLLFSLLSTTTIIAQPGWTPQNSTTQCNLNSIYFHNENNGWAVGTCIAGGLTMATIDGGLQWSFNYSIPLFSVQFIDENTGWTVGGDYNGGIIKQTSNGGINWITQLNLENHGFTEVSFIDENIGYVSGGEFTPYRIGAVFKTTDGGDNWFNTIQSYVTNGLLNSVYFVNQNLGWAVGENGVILKTTNGGNNWGIQTLFNANFSSVFFVDENFGWVVGNKNPGGIILKSTNGGTAWTVISVDTLSNNFVDDVFFIDSNIGWIVGENGLIIKTTNGGSNWDVQNSGTTNFLHSVHFIDQFKGWAVGNDGVILQTTNGGVTLIEEIDEALTYFQLSQNFPNPFNPTTKIKYSISDVIANEVKQSQFVNLKVYDVLGNEVATLVIEQKPAGTYEVEFNGNGLPSGIYFYQLKAGSFIETKKMVLLK